MKNQHGMKKRREVFCQAVVPEARSLSTTSTSLTSKAPSRFLPR